MRNFIAFHLRLAQDASFRSFAQNAGRRRWGPGNFAAMMVIRKNPGIIQVALGRAISRDKSTVTPLIQELQRRGLVSRRRSTSDRRSITLELTRAGEATLEDLLVHARAHNRRLDAILGKQKAVFLEQLRKIADELA
ncbi:MAG TPA: MarR family winged helix-turn-helix transcriptional regulator [Dongiaceae bacterium]|nr:MarR family winged helix-turn-helix transcriptional regulator [Dongiaceae bacterium]